jgi:hypothetical protein
MTALDAVREAGLKAVDRVGSRTEDIVAALSTRHYDDY